jgi:hypothetical protein
MVGETARLEVDRIMKSVEEIIRKAIDNEEFRALLLSNPEEALAGYELTDEERENLSKLGEEFFKAEDLEERISRWGFGLGDSI